MSIGAWLLLWTLADKSLASGSISSFQSVSLGKLTCCLSARIRIRRGQTDGKTLAVDLEGQTALFIIVGLPAQIGMLCCILCQPLFERGIVCLDFNGFAGFVKIDAGRFLPFIILLIAIPPCVSVVLSVFRSAAFAEHRSRFCRPAHPACPLLCATPDSPFLAEPFREYGSSLPI